MTIVTLSRGAVSASRRGELSEALQSRFEG
jgi:hypothetical protein